VLFFLFRRSVPLGRHPRLLSVAEVKPCRPPTSPAHNRDHLRLLGLVGCHGCRGLLALVVRKSLCRAILTNPKPEHLPRQARDKHLESTQKKTRVFSQGTPPRKLDGQHLPVGPYMGRDLYHHTTHCLGCCGRLPGARTRSLCTVSSYHACFHRIQHG
jgi:hypothetical protein